jgi:hypothetical protein
MDTVQKHFYSNNLSSLTKSSFMSRTDVTELFYYIIGVIIFMFLLFV